MSNMPSVMSAAAHFAQVPRAEIPRSSFDRSHGYKTTLNAGDLVPIFIDEVLPGDTFSLKMQGFARMATPLKPIMDNAYFNTFFFFVPNRLLWDNWEKFNGQQDNPGDSTDFLVPQVNTVANGFPRGGLFDYFGLPVGVYGLSVSALWPRAYNLIWNEWFRDENLQQRVVVPKGDGPDYSDSYNILKRGKRHDYFTSCLPWPQKGESVSLPLGTSAPVVGSGNGVPEFRLNGSTEDWTLGQVYNTTPQFMSFFNGNAAWTGPATVRDARWADPNLEVDLSEATAATINQLRQAFAVQRLYERDARGGTRYTEVIRSHFGVVSPDQRLQRPEYLGGGQSPVLISQVPQTVRTDIAAVPGHLGDLGAFGISNMRGHGFSKSFTEHGVLIGLVCVRADLTYQQGINRMWSRRGRFDFYWPALSHIGEQAVLSKEIFADASEADNDVFGYQERYAEYRYKNSMITGVLRSDHPQSLDVWHLGQDFETRPLLNSTFIEERPPFERVVAVPSEPTFILDCYFNLRCARPMPVYGVPGMIDHF